MNECTPLTNFYGHVIVLMSQVIKQELGKRSWCEAERCRKRCKVGDGGRPRTREVTWDKLFRSLPRNIG